MEHAPLFRRFLPFALSALVPVISSAQAGSLDNTFGTGGVVTTTLGDYNSNCYKLLVAPDGGLLAAGTKGNGADNDFALVKYHADGALDAAFGTGGVAITPVGTSNDNCYAAALQTDGKVVLGGDYANGSGGYSFAVVRYNANGTLDPGFGTGGIATVDMGSTDNYGTDIAVQPDGKVLLAGRRVLPGVGGRFVVARLNANGTLDNGFATNGILVLQVGPGSAFCYTVALQPDGKIILGGDAQMAAGWDVALVRLSSDGQLDPAFGTNGIAIHSLSWQDDFAYAMLLQADGRIVVAGAGYGAQSNLDHTIARFNSDGSLDATFGTDGATFSDFGSFESAFGVARASDGSYYVSASSSSLGFELSHYTTDGTLDTDFGTNGRVTTAVGSTFTNTNTSIAVDAQQRVIVAGYAVAPVNSSFVLLRYLTGPAAGIAEHSFDITEPSISPDPVTAISMLHFTLARNASVSISVLDAVGRTVPGFGTARTYAQGPHAEAMGALSRLSAGRYMLVVSTGEQREVLPFLKAE